MDVGLAGDNTKECKSMKRYLIAGAIVFAFVTPVLAADYSSPCGSEAERPHARL